MEESSVKNIVILALSFGKTPIVKVPLDHKNVSIGNSETSDILVPETSNIEFEVKAKSEGNSAIISLRYKDKNKPKDDEYHLAEKKLEPDGCFSYGGLEIKLDKKRFFGRPQELEKTSKSNTLRIIPETGVLETISATFKWRERGKERERAVTRDGIKVGKAGDNDVILPCEYISDHHLILVLSGGGVKVYDLHSTNGTWLGKTRIYEAFIVQDQILRLGDENIEIEFSSVTKKEKPKTLIEGFVAESKIMLGAVSLIARLAPCDETVLLLGETGTGKELLARALHHLSPARRKQPFIAVNCASIQPEIAESELFGHEKGSFTGADKATIGAFRAADKGTIFLDEIAELPLEIQAKLLRTLETKATQPLGASKEIPVDVRIIAATNRNLEKMVKEGAFREDLYYRLMVLPVEVPPLRERRQDIAPLAEYFLGAISPNHSLSKPAKEKLHSYKYPGNVRELKHILVRAAFMCKGAIITKDDIVFGERKSPARTANRADLFDRDTLLWLIKKTNGNETEMCRALKVSRSTLYRKLKSMGLSLTFPIKNTFDVD
ncbi:MAG: sigma 54-interacting transcriptional regulator [Phycisphaerae bacterium]|nr:sigma 54-interacting transcriptional regulator [Phycisphaerae bacterium]